MHRILVTLLAVCAVFATARAQDINGDGYVQVLLPIAVPSPRVAEGAFGSLWRQELWVANNSAVPFFTLQPGGVCAPAPCLPTIQPGGVISWFSMENNNFEGGAIFALDPRYAGDIHLSSRLLELSRTAQPAGVDIPLIREGDFRTGTITLAGVPTGNDVRSRLRIYDPRSGSTGAIRVELLSPDGTVLASTEVRLGNNPSAPTQYLPTFPLPSYAVLGDLQSLFPAVAAHARYHIRLTPITEQLEYWAFVAVTDIESQYFLLITPQ